MAKHQAVTSDKAPAAIGPYSQAVTVNGMIYTSGVIPIDPATGDVVEANITTQATRVLESLKGLLEDAGSGMDQIVKTTCFLQDLNDFATFNEVYASFMTGEAPPARSTVQVAKLPMGVLVEIEAVALLK